jgi:hypothetical protein
LPPAQAELIQAKILADKNAKNGEIIRDKNENIMADKNKNIIADKPEKHHR